MRQRLQNFEPENIYNFDESALFYRLGPNRTLAACKQKGQKTCKDRITFGLCCNATGTDKFKCIVIGKSMKPRCFKGFDATKFVMYRSAPTAWMNTPIFTDWLRSFNSHVANQNKHVALLIDNHTSHVDMELSNVTVIKLPPNTTSHLQPLDCGIIHSTKAQYRKLLVNLIISHVDVDGVMPRIDIKQCIQMLYQAWSKVSQQTIINCFRKSGLVFTDEEVDESVEDLQFNAELETDIASVMRLTSIDVPLTAREWIRCEDGVGTGEELTDDEILQVVMAPPEVDLDETDEIDNHIDTVTTISEGISGIMTAKRAIEQNMNAFSADDLVSVNDILSKMYIAQRKFAKQTKITDFFER